MFHQTETSQQRADRLLTEDQASRIGDVEPGHFVIIEGEPSRWERFAEALRPWVSGFDHPVMDAIGIFFLLLFGAIVGAFLALTIPDNEPPRGRAFEANTATSLPAVESPLDRRASGETL